MANYAESAGGSSRVNPRKAPSDAVCTSMRIRPTVNDGFVVTHDYESTARSKSGLGSPYVPSRDYTFSDADALAEHIIKTFGTSPAGKARKSADSDD